MLLNLAKLYNKIQLKFNKILFISNQNLSVGVNFRLGNYTTYIIKNNSKAIFGNNVDIRNNFNLVLEKEAHLTIHNNVFMNNNCSINCLDKIEIGENTLFGENVRLYDHNHKFDSSQIYHKEFTTSPIFIGENCWLGTNVTVLKGVTIGDNVIIGAGCVIHKDVPANSIIVNKQDHLIKKI
jgi:acetyltransferase-like isoleucine patch superfamily enzyme